jgi:Rhodopirellula transposase DDE domain
MMGYEKDIEDKIQRLYAGIEAAKLGQGGIEYVSGWFGIDPKTVRRGLKELELPAHYPPYCSKHNPIEHCLFPHVTRACQGVVFHSVLIASQFIEKAKTGTGLQVTVDVLDRV